MSLVFEIDIDEDKASRKLSLREKVAIRLLMVIFGMIYPAKHSHQTKEAFAPLLELLNN